MSLGHLSPGGGSSGGSNPSSMSSPSSGLLSSPIQSSIKRKRSGTVLNRLHQLLFGEGYSPPQVEQDADKKASEQLPTKKAQSILSQSLLKMNKANAMTTRLSVISEFSEFVRSYRVDDISSVWSAVKDLFDDDKSNEVKLFGFTLLQALIEGQYDQLSPSTRGEFFRIIAKHRRNSSSMWSDSLVALTRNGRDIVPFEKELLTLLLSCLGVESEKHLPIADSNALIGFITIASNVFKYNFYTIEDEPKVELVKSICLISYATSDIKVVKECLSFFDIHVRYGSLSSSSVSLFISALCRTVNIESFCEQSWKIMENLLKGHCGHQGIRALCVLLEDSNNFNSVNLLRGAVFFLGMFNWGSHKIATLHSTPAGVLPSLMNVLACGQLIVAYEVVLSIRRLVKKYGKELTVEWDVILQVISNLQPFATLVNTSLVSMLEDTLSTIEALVEQKHFSGDTDRLREVLFSYTPLRPEKNVLRLLHRSARYLNPTYPSWVSELQRFLVTFFQNEHRSLIRIKALEALLEKWKMYSCVYDAEMLEEILPYFVGLATETDSNVCAKVLEALLVFASSNSKRYFYDIADLFVTLALSANQKEVKILAVRALVQLFKLSFGTSRWAQTIHVYHHLSHLATTEDNGAKRESLAMLLSLRSNEAGQPFYLDHQNSSIVVDLFLSFDHSSDASNIQLLSSPTCLKSTQFVSTSTPSPVLPSTSLFNNLVGRLAKEDCPEVLLLILRGLRSLLRGFNVPRGSIHKIVPALSRLPKEKVFITGFFEAASKKLKEECLELAYDLLLLSIGYAHYWQITAQEEENREALVVCFENTCSTLKWGPNFAWSNHVSFELISSLQRRTFNAFSICNAELPLTMRRHISTILKFLGQLFFSSEGSLIPIDFAGEVVEYFRSLASSSSLLSAITVTDYSFIFRILLFLVEDVKTTSYLLHMTFRSLAHWLAVCPVSIRQQHYYTIKSSAARFAANHEDKKTLVESYVDLMATYAFSDVETSSSVKNDFPSIIFSEHTKYWLLGNAILSIRTGKLGWAEVTVRRPSGIMTWVLQIRNKLQSVRNKHEGNGSLLGNKKLPQSPTSPTSPTSPNQSYTNFNQLSSTTSPNSSINSSFDQSSVKSPPTEVFKSFSILEDTSLMVDLSLINDTSGRKRKGSSAAQHQHAHTSRPPVSTPPLSPPSSHAPLPTLLSATTSNLSLPTSPATHTPTSSSPPSSKSLVPALNLDLTSTTQILLQQDQPPPSKSVFIQSAKKHGQILHRRAVSISTPPSVSSEAGSGEDSQANKPDLLTLFYPPLPSYEGEDLHSPSFFYPTIPVASNPMICQNRLSIEAQMRLHSSFSSESSSLSDVSNPSSLSESFERTNSLPSSTFHQKHAPLIPVTEHPLMEAGERRECESLIPQTKRTPSSTSLVSIQHQQPEKTGGSGGEFHHTSHTHEKDDSHHTHYPLSSTSSSSSLLQTLEEKTSSENILAAIASTEHHANAHPPSTHLRRGSREDILTGFASSTLKVVSELPSVIPEQERSRTGGSLLELGGGGDDYDEALVLGDPVDDINPNFIFLQLHQIPFMNEKLLALKPTDGLERAIKCIDLIHSFESHKIGLIYVAENQTKEEEILANVQGSLRYSSFLKSMGDIVRLKDCVDIYVAGLDRSNDIDGEFSLFWKDQMTQLMFHVVTMMPNSIGASDNSNYLQKKRHIGNDFVSIVYSDSLAVYNQDVIPGQFNFVHIVIYPLGGGYNRVEVKKKKEIAAFGPLHHIHIVSDDALPVLVRSTAIFADIACRLSQDSKSQVSNFEERLRQIRVVRERFSGAAEPATAI